MKKVNINIIVILLLIILGSFVIIEGLILWDGRIATIENIENIDYVIVLGARLYGDIPSPVLEERLKVARDYMLIHDNLKVIVSGGQGPDEYISEAKAMHKYLVDNGIDNDRIIIEDKATSTFENLKMSLDKIYEVDDKKNPNILIATNKYHIFRAKFLARRLGVVPYGLPAKIPPTIILQSYIREYFAVIKSFLFDRI